MVLQQALVAGLRAREMTFCRQPPVAKAGAQSRLVSRPSTAATRCAQAVVYNPAPKSATIARLYNKTVGAPGTRPDQERDFLRANGIEGNRHARATPRVTHAITQFLNRS